MAAIEATMNTPNKPYKIYRNKIEEQIWGLFNTKLVKIHV
jgi:hypothetical protein